MGRCARLSCPATRARRSRILLSPRLKHRGQTRPKELKVEKQLIALRVEGLAKVVGSDGIRCRRIGHLQKAEAIHHFAGMKSQTENLKRDKRVQETKVIWTSPNPNLFWTAISLSDTAHTHL